MHLSLKYILVIFITCSCECHVNRSHFLSCSWRCKRKRDWGHKQRRLLWMSTTISKTQQTSMDWRTSKKTSDATTVSCARIRKLWKETFDTGGAAFLTPTKRYRHSRCLLVDDFDCVPIKWKMYHLYQAKEQVTLAKFLVVLKKDNRSQLSTFC